MPLVETGPLLRQVETAPLHIKLEAQEAKAPEPPP